MAKEFFTKTGNEKYRNISNYEEAYIEFLKYMINKPTPDYNTVLGKLKLLPDNISALLCIIHCVEVLSHYSTDIADNSGNTQSPTSPPSTEKQSSPRVSYDLPGERQAIGRPSPSRVSYDLPREREAIGTFIGQTSIGGGAMGRVDSKILDNVKISKYIKNIIKFYDKLENKPNINLKIFISNNDVEDSKKECYLQISFDNEVYKIDNINAYIIMTNIMYNDKQKLKDKFGDDNNLIKKLRSEINNVFFMDKELSSKAKGKYERTFASAKKIFREKIRPDWYYKKLDWGTNMREAAAAGMNNLREGIPDLGGSEGGNESDQLLLGLIHRKLKDKGIWNEKIKGINTNNYTDNIQVEEANIENYEKIVKSKIVDHYYDILINNVEKNKKNLSVVLKEFRFNKTKKDINDSVEEITINYRKLFQIIQNFIENTLRTGLDDKYKLITKSIRRDYINRKKLDLSSLIEEIKNEEIKLQGLELQLLNKSQTEQDGNE